MRKFSLSFITLSVGLGLLPLAQAANTPAQQHLLEQVRLGEASSREDLVRQSLYRLELIDPKTRIILPRGLATCCARATPPARKSSSNCWRNWLRNHRRYKRRATR